MRVTALWLLFALGACGDEATGGREVCDNAIDDDGDGDLDCADADCAGECPEVCGDDVDNDGDGEVDCLDADCDGSCPEDCDDERDNDGDGRIDCLDTDCAGLCPEVCDDGVDNDGNGAIDCADPGCAGECPEVCDDGRDNDADGRIDCLDTDCASTCDADGDGHLALAYGGDDCRDDDDAIHPGQTEVCNGDDDDCDGWVDEEDPGLDRSTLNVYYGDDDLDGFGDPDDPVEGCSQEPGTVPNADDCDDGAFGIKPSADEVCDDIDNDCDGRVDDDDDDVDPVSEDTWFADQDGDGVGDDAETMGACTQPDGYVAAGGDCYPFDASLHGDRDWWADGDGDGWGAGEPSVYCLAPAGWVTNDGDCDDGDPDLSPETPWFADDDGDGYGDPEWWLAQCVQPDGYVADDQDCDDTDAAVNPDSVWYADGDGDGWGDAADSLVTCAPDDVRALVAGDCDDTDPLVGGPVEWWIDADGDGVGDGVPTEPVCGDRGEGWALAGPVDCDERRADVHPGAFDACEDGEDTSCDGLDPLCADPLTGEWHLADVPDRVIGHREGDVAGIAVAPAGDLNGDGLDDLLVGASGADGNVGSAGVLYGPLYGAVSMADADARIAGGAGGDKLGGDLTGLGDVDGDGLGDILVGARNADWFGADAGEVWLFTGPLVGELGEDDAAAIIAGTSFDDRLGEVVGRAGDTDGDGLADLVIGAQSAAGDDGQVWIVPSTARGRMTIDDATEVTFVGEAPNDELGSAVAGAGDLNGDGLGDILVGARYSDHTASNAGSAYVFHTPFAGTLDAGDADARLRGVAAADKAGRSVAGGGDVDGDGTPDLLIGAPFTEGGGEAYLVSGTVAGELDLAHALATLPAESPGDRAAYSVAIAEDIDRDGHADLVIGADLADPTGADAGITYVVYGPVTGVFGLGSADARLLGAAGDQAGQDVAAAGDIDGNGHSDVLVGSWHADEGGPNAGAAYLLYGSGL